MRVPRIYIPELHTPQQPLLIEGQAARHLLQVLRVKPGQELVLFDGSGEQFHATVTTAGRQTVHVQITSSEHRDNESNLDITLVQCISRGERMDWTLQKATELGVRTIVPVFSERSMVKLDGKRLHSRMQHWGGVIQHACEQSGRNVLPELVTPVSLLERLQTLADATVNLYLDPGSAQNLKGLKPAKAVELFIGPEGGFSPDEELAMQAHGVTAVNLGPRILRTETAALAAISVMGSLWGDL